MGPGESEATSTSTYVGIVCVASATLLLEITLTRIYSYTIWYHFAFIVIAMALLGFGASGSLLVERPTLLGGSTTARLSNASCASAAGVALVVAILAFVPFDPFAIGSDPLELGVMALCLAGTTVPFFFAGSAIAVALTSYSRRSGALYFADLAGAAAACAAFVFLMAVAGPLHILGMATALFVLGALAFGARGRAGALIGVSSVALVEVLAFTHDLVPCDSKLGAKYVAAGAVRVHSAWSAVFRTDVYDFTDRLSLDANPALTVYGARVGGAGARFTGEYPPFRFITHDGDASAVMVKAVPAADDVDLLRHHLLSFPWKMRPGAQALIGGVGGGIDLLSALSNGVGSIHGVELDPNTVDATCNLNGDYVGHACQKPKVHIEAGDARGVIRRNDERYDVINFTGVDTITSSATGAYLLSEGYLYTVEAFEDYFDHLRPDGVVSIITGDVGGAWGLPRMVPRFASVIATALERRGVRRPADHVIIVGSFLPQDAGITHEVVLAKLTPFTEAEVARAKQFADDEGFAPWHLPGARIDTSASKILRLDPEARRDYEAGFHLDYSPVTDDRPFFMHFYKWSRLFGNVKIDTRYVEATGNVVLLSALVFAVLGAFGLVIWPAMRHAKRSGPGASLGAPWIAYFSALGFGFMLVEMSLIQQLEFFLGYPTYSLTITLSSLLSFAALGALFSHRTTLTGARPVWLAVAALAGLTLAYASIGHGLLVSLLHLPLGIRCTLAVVFIAPLGFVLGVFLPTGVRALGSSRPAAVPLAWAANGSASVVGTVGSVMLATVIGFRGVALCAVVIYALGAFAFQRAVSRAGAGVPTANA
jgi:hypothetical protein